MPSTTSRRTDKADAAAFERVAYVDHAASPSQAKATSGQWLSHLLFVRAGKPYVSFMAVATLCYLIFELGFNARLLDVAGSVATKEQISSIEKWGRVISGIALTLAVWGVVLLPRAFKLPEKRWSSKKIVVVLGVSAAICVTAAYKLERALIDVIVDRSSGVERRDAAHLQAVSTAVLSNKMTITGIDLSGDELSQPEGKAFLSIFPMVALSTPDLNRKTETILHDAVRLTAEAQAGSPSKVYNEKFLPSVKTMANLYDSYVDGVERYNAALQGSPAQQQASWNDYTASLYRKSHRSPANLPRAYWSQNAAAVRAHGVAVPEGWPPADQQAFYAAVDRRIRGEADAAYRSQSQANAGEVLPTNLQFQDFVARPSVQTRWRNAIAAPDDVELTPKMSLTMFSRDIYEPRIERITSDQVGKLLKPAPSFADGGENAEQGREAMEGLAVRPIALAFSLFGAMVHIFKASRYLSQWALPHLPRRTTLIGIPLLLIGFSAFLLPNAVSRSQGFAVLEQHVEDDWGWGGYPITYGIRWTVQAQPYFYLLNERVRRYALLGYGFGYERAEDKPASVP